MDTRVTDVLLSLYMSFKQSTFRLDGVKGIFKFIEMGPVLLLVGGQQLSLSPDLRLPHPSHECKSQNKLSSFCSTVILRYC